MMPINEWWEEREKALRILRRDLQDLPTDILRRRLEAGAYHDSRIRALAEAEWSRRQAGAAEAAAE